MNQIYEKYAVLAALAPQSLADAASKDGVFVDMQSRDRFAFSVLLGAVAAGKSAKVELLSSASVDGSGAVVEGNVTYTAPDGGVESHVVIVSGKVIPQRGRYLGVRVTNQGSAALLASAMLVADSAWYPEETSGTTLVV